MTVTKIARVLSVVLVASGCNVYDASLLSDGGDGGAQSDVAVEACTTTCTGKCVDTTMDANNCGACGVTCETGCANSLCKPTVLAGSLGAPHGLLLSGASLYVANNGAINIDVMSKIDGTGLKNFATAQLLPDRLTTDGTTLYWTDDTDSPHPASGTIDEEAFAQTPCNGTSTFCYLAQDLPSPYGIAVQSGTLFFTTTAATNASGAGCAADAWASSVLSCPVGGCASTACNASGGPTVLASNQTKLAGIAVDAKNIYWADSGGHEVRFCPQPNCAGGPKVFAQIAGAPFDVVSDGTNVFFTDRTGGNLYACPTNGCGSSFTPMASNLTDPLLVAVDAQNAYVTEYAKGAPGKGAIAACDLPACAGGAKTIASGLKAPYGIALDATYVYWAEEGSSGNASTDGAVSKLKR